MTVWLIPLAFVVGNRFNAALWSWRRARARHIPIKQMVVNTVVTGSPSTPAPVKPPKVTSMP